MLIGQSLWFRPSAWLHAQSWRFVHRGSPSRILIGEWKIRNFVAPCYAVVAVHVVVRHYASFVMCRCALLLTQIQGRFGRRFGVGLGAITGVVSSAILASFRALSYAVWSAIRALFRRLFWALSLAQSGNISRAVLGAISRSHLFTIVTSFPASFRRGSKHHIGRCFKNCPYVVPFAFAASPVSPLAPPLTPSLAPSLPSCLAPSRLSRCLSGVFE